MEVSDEIEVLDVISHDKCILTTNYRDCFLSTADFPLFSFHPWAGCSFLLFSPRTLFPVSPKAAHRVENNIFSSYLIFFSKDILENSHCASSLISYSKKPTEGYLYRLKTQEYGDSKCSKLRIYWSQLPCISSFSKAGFLISVQRIEPMVLHILGKCSTTMQQPKLETRIAFCEWELYVIDDPFTWVFLAKGIYYSEWELCKQLKRPRPLDISKGTWDFRWGPKNPDLQPHIVTFSQLQRDSYHIKWVKPLLNLWYWLKLLAHSL